eukprot:87436-Rhodomonas_salina.1
MPQSGPKSQKMLIEKSNVTTCNRSPKVSENSPLTLGNRSTGQPDRETKAAVPSVDPTEQWCGVDFAVSGRAA